MSKVIKMKKKKEIPFHQLSRNQKRRQTFYINKRAYTVFEVIKLAEKELPLMIDKKGRRISHYDNMLKLYMDGGMDEVKRYNKSIFEIQDKVERRAKHKRIWQKILGLFGVSKGSPKSSSEKPSPPLKKEERKQAVN